MRRSEREAFAKTMAEKLSANIYSRTSVQVWESQENAEQEQWIIRKKKPDGGRY